MFLVDKLFFVGKRMAIIAAFGLLSFGATLHAGARSSSHSNTIMQPAPLSLNLTVNSLSDTPDITLDGNCDADAVTAGNQCTLRAALQETNNNPGNDTIGFDPSLSGGTITLLTRLPVITDNLAINGLGANQLTVERLDIAATRYRIFKISSGVTVSISGLTMAKGNEDSSFGGPFGEIIGGGIFNDNGILTLTNVVVTGNRANSQGGGIFNTGTLTITNSTISNNSNIGSGGGLYNSGTLTITGSTFSNNVVLGGGGGIYNDEGTVTLKNSTISNNSGDSAGGGILSSTSGQTFTITNCTITGNRSGASGGPGGFGGGINKLNGVFFLSNTIVAGNFRGTGTAPYDISGTMNSATNNLIGDASTSGGIINANNGNRVGNNGSGTININTVLNTTLADNGGPTRTHALVAGSPAIDAGNNLIVDSIGLTTDQRGAGFNRKVDSPDADTTATVDIGAFEAQFSPNAAPSFTKGPDQTINEDAGSQTVSPWATGISPGSPDDSGQTLSFQVTNNTNPGLFAVQPAISPTGVLTYTPAANANGSADITIVLKDNGGTSNGGSDTSPPQTFKITVNPVNDAPTFTKGQDQVVPPVSGPQTVPNWATNISPGPADESGQTVGFTVTNNNNAFFSMQPAIDPSGTLTYTIAPGAIGSATVTAVLTDNGGTANGGQDTSAPQTFIITNDPKAWTTTGVSGATEDESNPARLTYTNFTASANAGSPAGSYVLRYNITSVGDLTAGGALNTRLRVRFRDEGQGSRVTVAIMRGGISGGATTLGTVFDSDTYAPSNGFQAQEILMPALTFDFTLNLYWLEVTLVKDSSTNQPAFGAAQIKQQ